jgi:hypothetical protein
MGTRGQVKAGDIRRRTASSQNAIDTSETVTGYVNRDVTATMPASAAGQARGGRSTGCDRDAEGVARSALGHTAWASGPGRHRKHPGASAGDRQEPLDHEPASIAHLQANAEGHRRNQRGTRSEVPGRRERDDRPDPDRDRRHQAENPKAHAEHGTGQAADERKS